MALPKTWANLQVSIWRWKNTSSNHVCQVLVSRCLKLQSPIVLFFFRFHVKPVQSDQPLLPLCCQTRTTTKYRIICLSVKLQRVFFFLFFFLSLFYFILEIKKKITVRIRLKTNKRQSFLSLFTPIRYSSGWRHIPLQTMSIIIDLDRNKRIESFIICQ